MEETKELVDYISALSYHDLPSDVVGMAKLCLLDTIGVALYGSRMPWTKVVAKIIREAGSKKESTVWGKDFFDTVASSAALVNGTAAHGIEMDDRQSELGVHTGAMVIPAALAAGERVSASGKDLLAAIVSGYEVSYRVARAVPGQVARGFHTPAHMGMWGAVAAACKVMSLNREQMLDAFGIAGSFVSGIREFSNDPVGNMIKRIHGGWAAQSGVVSAMLSENGLTGPCTVLEGKYGYCRVFAGQVEPKVAELTRGLGDSFEIRKREVKPYAAWGGSHMCIDALSGLVAEHSIKADQIEHIVVGGSRTLIELHESREPESIMAGQYSLPFIIALSLYKDLRDPGVWSEEVLHDEEVKDLTARISWYVDAEMDSISEKTQGYGGVKIDITLKNHTQLRNVIYHSKGTVENPMSEDELLGKFRLLARYVLPVEQVELAIDAINQVDCLEDLSKLGRIFQAARQ